MRHLYIATPDDLRLYLDTETTEKSLISADGGVPSIVDRLWLDLDKANPHRDPALGEFISGGVGKAQSGEGQQFTSLEDEIEDPSRGQI